MSPPLVIILRATGPSVITRSKPLTRATKSGILTQPVAAPNPASLLSSLFVIDHGHPPKFKR
jgi:hypothetical protein